MSAAHVVEHKAQPQTHTAAFLGSLGVGAMALDAMEIVAELDVAEAVDEHTVAPLQPGHGTRPGTTKRINDGYHYTKACGSGKQIVSRCSKYRSKSARGMPILCDSTVVNVPDDMEHLADRLALEDLSTTAATVLGEVSSFFYLPIGDSVSSFQFHHVLPNASCASKPHRVIGWALLAATDKRPTRTSPKCSNLLKYKSTTILVDVTFRCLPRNFAQCVIIMVHDNASDEFVPVFFVLTTSKTSDTYWDVIHFVIKLRTKSLSLFKSYATSSEDLSTLSAPKTQVTGCLFHWKQALRRKMKSLCIPENQVNIAMERGVVDMLTGIPHGFITCKVIAWVRRKIRERCAELSTNYAVKTWKRFWAYFHHTWIDTISPRFWNVCDLDQGIRISSTTAKHDRVRYDHLRSFERYLQKRSNFGQGRSQRKKRETIMLPTPAALSHESSVDAWESESEDRVYMSFDYLESARSSDSDAEFDADMVAEDAE
ncbi:TPA: LOW QUALITY PROTEIN: hypothetical protein N0F65_008857 [Lagenidium giganteum]|uniref:MULE transposase domain-containing protein n=1 Tax=Lagenidium giganteum TaxID=4803 RepID=A0AAV2YT56_9STRA|nr:TPA: LOW QUALITY PROTEIN: hypothetical protein N0F65_008857 [Lagenidium giganteum]